MALLEEIDWFVNYSLIKAHFPDLKVVYGEKAGIKIISFSIFLPASTYAYKFLIYYKPQFVKGVQQIQPLLFCGNPDIIRDTDNHINLSGQICYFFPGDLTFKSGISCLYAMQAAIKWSDCYNYWLKNKIGGWPAAEMPHGSYAPAYFNINRPLL